MPTILPKDDDNNPIPALRLKDGKAHKIIASSTANRNSVPFSFGTKVISLFTTEDIYIEFGDENIVSDTNSHFFPAGVYYDFAINNCKQAKDTHISVLKAGTNNANVYISEKE
ncbi:MAG: hypothetical protein OIF36_00980 [Alphaproteobacteria bacterium]|nr:hypothetical protein [Alphaproteobacteria bacterium]